MDQQSTAHYTGIPVGWDSKSWSMGKKNTKKTPKTAQSHNHTFSQQKDFPSK